MAERPKKYKKSPRQKEKERKKRFEENRLKKARTKEKEKRKKRNAKERKKRHAIAMRKYRREQAKKRAKLEKLLNKPIHEKAKADYKIIFVSNGKQKEYVGKYYSIQEAYYDFNNLKEEERNIVYPKKSMNSNGRKSASFEYLLLERNYGDSKNNILRNEYGKLVEHKTNSNKWVILDKCSIEIEETFWVYGFDPRYDRKEFMWIYENCIKEPILNGGGYENRLILLYGNKVLIKCDSGKIEMVITKNRNEGIRFYNKIIEFVEKDKLKGNVLMMGSVGGKSEYTSKVISEIEEMTGWDRKKIVRMTTEG